jgi:hypothetical protein
MELNILLDQLIPASHISLLHLKNRHFLVGLVDVDEDDGIVMKRTWAGAFRRW